MICLDDFRCMRRGVVHGMITPEDASFLTGYEKRGKGKQRALLLLHGFSSSPLVFRRFFPHLTRYDAILAPVLPGHGESVAAFSKIRAKDWINAVEPICAALCQDYASVDVPGLSLGGVLAHHLSKTFPLNHLYLLAPAFNITDSTRVQRIARWAYRLGFVQIRNQAGNLYGNDHCEIAYRQLPLSTALELFTSIHHYSFTPPTCPTDVFLGCHDHVIDTAQVAGRFDSLPHVNVHWLQHTAHVIPLDRDRKQVLSYLL